jgi:hypothetical protein
VNPSRAPIGLLTRYPDFYDVFVVAGRAVLFGCSGTSHTAVLKVLDLDLVHGKDIAIDHRACNEPAVVGDTLVFPSGYLAGHGTEPAVAVHIPDGKVDVYNGPPAGRPDDGEVVLGDVRYRRARTDQDRADGTYAFDRASNRLLWHALWGETSFPVASEGAIVVRMVETLVELDPANGNVLWERAAPGEMWKGETGITKLTAEDGQDAFAVIERPYPPEPSVPGIVIYNRGAPPSATWTGTIRGTVTNVGEGGKGKAPFKGVLVTAGSKSVKTDRRGKYAIRLTTSGKLLVDTEIQPGAGSTADSKVLDLEAGHGDYTVDLGVAEFQQACR